jgi:hypothetical protein
MKPRELYQLLQALKPKWSADGIELGCSCELDGTLMETITRGVEFKFIDEMVRIEKSRRVRKLDTVNESFYGKQIFFKFSQRNNIALIFSSIDLLVQSNPVTPPSSFIIYNATERTRFYDTDDDKCNPIGEIKHYLEISEIWKGLKVWCDHQSSNAEMTFLYRKKLTLKSNYDPKVIKNEFDGLDRFIRILKELDDDAHKDGKAHILQNTLVNVLGHIPEKDRFECLLNNFTKFTSKFDDAYQAYVVGFSFDDLRKEHEERYREYMVKVNDVVSSSLMKALMVPGALYLTATRTQALQTSKPISNAIEITIVNFGIGLAAIAICMIYWWILCNEKSSLSSIKIEYTSLMDRLQDKSPEAFKTIKDYMDVLDNKIRDAESAITMLKVINIVCVLASLSWVIFRFFP